MLFMQIRSPFNILFILALCFPPILANANNHDFSNPTQNHDTEATYLEYRSTSSNRFLEELDRQDDFAAAPYKVSLFNPTNGEDSERLWSQTKSIGFYGLGVAGALALMPESITNWEKDDVQLMNQWWDNVRQGPVWDRDAWVINYIGHPDLRLGLRRMGFSERTSNSFRWWHCHGLSSDRFYRPFLLRPSR